MTEPAHLHECTDGDCTGYLGPAQVFVCLCWCHHNPREGVST